MIRTLLLAALLAVAGCVATSPDRGRESEGGPAAEQADAARVSFHVTGLKKTRSGAT